MDSSPKSIWAWTLAATPPGRTTLGRVLLAYRASTGLTQAQLGALLGLTQPHVSRLERGERTIRDITSLRRIATTLAVPPQLLGVTDLTARTSGALELAVSALRLAVLLRWAGHPHDAAMELWPVVALLEAEAARGRHDPAFLRMLVHARITFGTTLGHVLAPEQLDVVLGWTGRALALAEQLPTAGCSDPPLTAEVRRMHGNELRKAGRLATALAELRRAAASGDRIGARGAGFLLLARAAAEAGRAATFDQAVAHATRLLDTGPSPPLLHPYSLGEVRLRGAVRLGRRQQITMLLADRTASEPPTPQWQVLQSITTAEAHLALGEHETALVQLRQVIPAATAGHLPQQLMRIIRVLEPSRGDPVARAVRDTARSRLDQLASSRPPAQLGSAVSG